MRGLGKVAVAVALAAALLTACGSRGPTPECDQNRPYGSATISCQDAVSLARAQLPANHPDITRIQFLYGSYRPLLPQVGAMGAYVVFTFSDTSRQAVQLWLSQGKVAAESPSAY
jgi:hypothetical protein